MNTTQKQREKIVRNAEANQRLEGLTVSDESKKIAHGYVVGKAPAKAAAAQIKARYGVK